MALTGIEQIRLRIGDRPRFNREQFDGDGVLNEFDLQHSPVTALPAPAIWVNDVSKVEGVDFTIDYLHGIVTFVAAPLVNKVVIVQYSSVVWSDAEITDFLETSDNSVTLAAYQLLYAWAALISRDVIKESRSGGGGMGAITIDTSVRAREMRATADALKKQYDQYEGTGDAVEFLTEIAWTDQMADRIVWNSFWDQLN